MATLPTLSRRQIDMRRGSEFIRRLQEGLKDADYEILPYVRIGDAMVGCANTAPPGQKPWWVPNKPFQPAHMFAFSDERILADIARRLRDETPLTIHPAASLPN